MSLNDVHYTRLLPPLILINLLTCVTAQAASPNVLDGTEWELCGEPGDGHAPARADEPAIGEGDQATYLSADQSEITQGDTFNFSGDVLMRRADQRLEADKAIYDKPKDTIDAQGNVRYEQGGLALDAASAQLELSANKGEAQDTSYRIAEKHARGDAAKIILERPNHFRLKHARYTTCNPGSDAWYIHSTDVKLDHDKGVGSARHVWLEFKGVPFLYLPYMSFPLDERRKSGFLTPSFGNSDAVGTEIITPYYWNIAPQRDATITPRMTSLRGMHLMGEYRYLYANGGGKIEAGYLPQDRVANRDRSFFSLRHSGNIAERWTTAVNFNYVSDTEYFKDLGNSLSVSSITHLERLAETTYTSDFWTATARLQGFQTVDQTLPGSSRPYQRLPQLLFSANLPDQ
ncbi:MAG TPA: LPS assembly protein LptD, partial [Gammaproteobacteria bacterium]|nr:LPS assembly protein LptD [Gammaproteobacteria bacterium]